MVDIDVLTDKSVLANQSSEDALTVIKKYYRDYPLIKSKLSPSVVKEIEVSFPRYIEHHSKEQIEIFSYCFFKNDRNQPLELTKFELEWIELLEWNRSLILAPRDHGKSFIFSLIVPMWRIVKNRNIRILLIGKTLPQAKKPLRLIKKLLENDMNLISYFGPFYSGKEYWTESYIYCMRTNTFLKDPTLEVIGTNGSITGGRFDLIISDDMIDDMSAKSDKERHKTKDWWYGTVLELLEEYGKSFTIGTRKHYKDIYSTFIEDVGVKYRIYKSIIKYPTSYDLVWQTDQNGKEVVSDIANIKGDYEVLWKDKWDIKKLLIKKASSGILFDRENQNEIVYEEYAEIKMDWLQKCLDKDREYWNYLTVEERDNFEFVAVLQGWDLSIVKDKKQAEEKDTDYTVCTTIAVDKHMNRYVINVFRERGLSPREIRNHIVAQYRKFMPDRIVIESNIFQSVYIYDLVEETDLPIKGHNTNKRSKADYFQGLPIFATLIENGKYSWPYKTNRDKILTDIVIAEFHEIPVGKHDDCVMSSYMVESKMPDVRNWLYGNEEEGGVDIKIF